MIVKCGEEKASMHLLGSKPLYSSVKKGGFEMEGVFGGGSTHR